MSSKQDKKRLDVLLIDKGFFESRQRAQAAIMAGVVFVNDKKEEKSGSKYPEDVEITVKENTCPYVSRGGLKLEKALKEFQINLKDKICIDAGASSGGFTDCILQNGAQLVYAVDVGYGQLDWKLRSDERVVVLERTNIRHLDIETLYKDKNVPKASFCSMDLSFISVTKVIDNILTLMEDEKHFVILLKPQFEAGKDQVPKSGVVKDKKIHFEIIENVCNYCEKAGLKTVNLTYSPLKGPSGNIEFLGYFNNQTENSIIDQDFIGNVVDLAHQELNQNG